MEGEKCRSVKLERDCNNVWWVVDRKVEICPKMGADQPLDYK